MKAIRVAQILLAIISGMLLIGYREVDDSPEAQGVGLMTIISSLVIVIYYLYKKYK